jgi:hypothetical protein
MWMSMGSSSRFWMALWVVALGLVGSGCYRLDEVVVTGERYYEEPFYWEYEYVPEGGGEWGGGEVGGGGESPAAEPAPEPPREPDPEEPRCPEAAPKVTQCKDDLKANINSVIDLQLACIAQGGTHEQCLYADLTEINRRMYNLCMELAQEICRIGG